MKDSGIMRRVDSLGRFVLPKELRRQLQIECNDYLQIYTEGEKIIIQKAQCNCALCGRTDDLIDFNDKNVCKSCVSLIKDYLCVIRPNRGQKKISPALSGVFFLPGNSRNCVISRLFSKKSEKIEKRG